MSDFKAQMHQIRFPLGFRAASAPPDPLAVVKGPTSKGREGKGEGEKKGKEREGGEGEGTEGREWEGKEGK